MTYKSIIPWYLNEVKTTNMHSRSLAVNNKLPSVRNKATIIMQAKLQPLNFMINMYETT